MMSNVVRDADDATHAAVAKMQWYVAEGQMLGTGFGGVLFFIGDGFPGHCTLCPRQAASIFSCVENVLDVRANKLTATAPQPTHICLVDQPVFHVRIPDCDHCRNGLDYGIQSSRLPGQVASGAHFLSD